MSTIRLFNSAKYQVLENIIVKFLGGILKFGVNYFVALVLGPAGKGILSFLEVILNLLFTVGHLSIFKTILYYLNLENFKYSRKAIFISSSVLLLIANIITLIIFIILYLLYPALFFKIPFHLVLIFILILPFKTLIESFSFFLQCLGNIHKMNLIIFLKGFIIAFFIFLLYFLTKTINLNYIAISFFSNYFVLFIIAFFLLKPVLNIYDEYKKIKPDKTLYKTLLKGGFILHLGYISTYMLIYIDQLMLKQMAGLSEVGFYSFGVNIFNGLLIISEGIQTVLISRISKNNISKQTVFTKVVRALKYSFILSLFIAVISYFTIGKLINFFLPNFSATFESFKFLLPGLIFLSLSLQLGTFFLSTGKYKINSIAAIIAVLLNIGLNLILIPEYQSKGAAISSSISYGIHLILLLIFVLKNKS